MSAKKILITTFLLLVTATATIVFLYTESINANIALTQNEINNLESYDPFNDLERVETTSDYVKNILTRIGAPTLKEKNEITHYYNLLNEINSSPKFKESADYKNSMSEFLAVLGKISKGQYISPEEFSVASKYAENSTELLFMNYDKKKTSLSQKIASYETEKTNIVFASLIFLIISGYSFYTLSKLSSKNSNSTSEENPATTYPFIQCDKDFKIKYINSSAISLLKKINIDKNLIGKDISEFHNGIKKSVSEYINSSSAPKKGRLRFGEEFLDIKINYIKNKKDLFDGIYLNLSIVTEQVKNEESSKKTKDAVQKILDSIYNGDTEKRLDPEDFSGTHKDLALGINELMDSMTPISICIDTLKKLSTGDLTCEMKGRFKGLFGDVQKNLNETIDTLRQSITKTNRAAQDIIYSVKENYNFNTEISEKTEQQTYDIQETSRLIKQLTILAKDNFVNFSYLKELSSKIKNIASEDTDNSNKSKFIISSIEQSLNKIHTLTEIIDEIAFKSNLIAFNTAVEASKVGEEGKSFLVIADEFRSLADKTSKASKEIRELTENSYEITKEITEKPQRSNLVNYINSLIELVKTSSEKAEKQIRNIDQISDNVSKIDISAKVNNINAQKSINNTEIINKQLSELEEATSFFVTEEFSQLVPNPPANENEEEEPKLVKVAGGGWEEY